MASRCEQKGVERKQSDLDSGLELEDRSPADLASQLLLLQAQNASLIGRVEELQSENRRLVEELENNSRIVSTGNLTISTLTLMLQEREATLESLEERHGSMSAVLGGADGWSLGVLRQLLEAGWNQDEPSDRLRQLVGLLEEALTGMDRALEREACWKAEALREMKKLHLQLRATTAANNDLRDKVEWYEAKTNTLEQNLRNRLRNYNHLKARLNELQDKNELLLNQINEKKHKKLKKNNMSRQELTNGSICVREKSCNPNSSFRHCSQNRPCISDQVTEEECRKIKIRLLEEETNNRNLKAQVDRLTGELFLMKEQRNDFEIKANNLSLLRKNFIKLALKHKRSVDVANENIAKLKGTILQLKEYLKIFGHDFVERAMASKCSVEAALGDSAFPASSLSSSEISDIFPSEDSESNFQDVKFEEVPLEEVVSGETIEEEVDSTFSSSSNEKDEEEIMNSTGFVEVSIALPEQ